MSVTIILGQVWGGAFPGALPTVCFVCGGARSSGQELAGSNWAIP